MTLKQRDQQHGAHRQRQGDLAHPRPEARAIDHGGLVDLARDGLDGRDEQHHAEAQDLPGDRQDDGPGGQLGVRAQPQDRLIDEPDVHAGACR